MFATDPFTINLLNISTQEKAHVLGMVLYQWLHLMDLNTFENVLKTFMLNLLIQNKIHVDCLPNKENQFLIFLVILWRIYQ